MNDVGIMNAVRLPHGTTRIVIRLGMRSGLAAACVSAGQGEILILERL